MAEEKAVQELLEAESPEVHSADPGARLRPEPWPWYPGESTIAVPGAVVTPQRRPWIQYSAALAVLPLLLLFVGFFWESKVTARVAREYPMRGQLVDVGGYRLHLYCIGTGTPTVVLDSGFDDANWEWSFVQPQVAKMARVCSYDRAGVGWSDPGPLPRTSGKMAEELHTALAHAGIPGPYLLVGHSFGGLNALLFASQHPEEVAGLVLVDSVHPGHYPADPLSYADRLRSFFYPIAAPFGITRMLGGCSAGPPNCRQYAETFAAQRESREESAREVRNAPLPPGIPLTVLAHDPEAHLRKNNTPEVRQYEEAWEQWQHGLALLSSNSTFILAKDTGHHIPARNPQIIVTTIARMIQSNRSH